MSKHTDLKWFHRGGAPVIGKRLKGWTAAKVSAIQQKRKAKKAA